MSQSDPTDHALAAIASILDHPEPHREPEKAAELVQNSKSQLAFFLNPTHVEEVKAIADAKSRMPQKSTDFYPKLLSGVVINDVSADGAA